MRYVLEPTIKHLHHFIAQRDKLVLILRSSTADSLAMLKLIDGLDDPHASELFWTYNDAFIDAKSYVNSIVAGFSTRHRLVKMALEQKGLKAWIDIPEEILSDEAEPIHRLRLLTSFSRKLLPVSMGGNNVWIFFPMKIENDSAYTKFMHGFLSHTFPNPWCHHLRFIVREDPTAPVLSSTLKGAPSVDVHEPDLGADAVARSLEREINDVDIPIEERLSSLVVMAGVDVAQSRFQESLEKYALVLEYYIPRENNTMIAIALNGMGEVYVRMGDETRANEAFESALIPASHGENPPLQVFLNASMNLAMLRMTQNNWEQAAGYWDVVRQTSIITRDPSTKIRALDQLGYCQYRMNELDAAEQTWLEGAELAANVEEESLFVTLMQRRRGLYLETRQTTKEREITALLEAMK
jgi:tetratricopeptide (TPR) repeat protein